MERARTGPTHDRERQIREEMDRANSSFGESEYVRYWYMLPEYACTL